MASRHNRHVHTLLTHFLFPIPPHHKIPPSSFVSPSSYDTPFSYHIPRKTVCSLLQNGLPLSNKRNYPGWVIRWRAICWRRCCSKIHCNDPPLHGSWHIRFSRARRWHSHSPLTTLSPPSHTPHTTPASLLSPSHHLLTHLLTTL